MNAEHQDDDHESGAEQLDAEWALELLQRTLARMQHYCNRSQRPEVWEVFEARLVDPALSGSTPMAYDKLVEHFTLETPRQASGVMNTALRTFSQTFRSLVAEYTPDDDLDREIQQLRLAVLSTHGKSTERLLAVAQDACHDDPERVGELVSLGSAPRFSWETTDFESILRHQLSLSCKREMENAGEVAGAPRNSPSEAAATPSDFKSVLVSETPSLEMLVSIKEFAKLVASDPQFSLPDEVAKVLYFAAITVARLQLDERISRLNDVELRYGCGWTTSRQWVPECLKQIFRKALTVLD